MNSRSKIQEAALLDITEKQKLLHSLYERKEYEQAISQHKKLLVSMKQELGHEHPSFLRILDDLAGVYSKMRDLRTASAVTVWGLTARGHEPFSIDSIETADPEHMEHLIEIVQAEIRLGRKQKITVC